VKKARSAALSQSASGWRPGALAHSFSRTGGFLSDGLCVIGRPREHDHAKYRRNRSVSRLRGDTPCSVYKFRLSGQALPSRFRLRCAQYVRPMAQRVGDLRMAGRQPGDARVAADGCSILHKRPRVPGGLAMRRARAARRRSVARRMRTRVAATHLILSRFKIAGAQAARARRRRESSSTIRRDCTLTVNGRGVDLRKSLQYAGQSRTADREAKLAEVFEILRDRKRMR